ncbi:MAG: hypothetical protein SVX43_10685 [Cyanobacteriota bacterium]|nr:hypothetical protein [Cyanobacteriota bacterium]
MERREMFIYDRQGAVALGREAGREEGREEGREKEKLAIAQNLLTLLDDEAIAATTRLSLEAVRELREQMN